MTVHLSLQSTIRKFRTVRIEDTSQVCRIVSKEHKSSGEATIKEYLMVHQENQCKVRRSVKCYNLAAAGVTAATVKENLTVRQAVKKPGRPQKSKKTVRRKNDE